MPHVGESPSFAQNKNVRKVLLWAVVVVVVLGSIVSSYQVWKKARDEEEAEQKVRAARVAEPKVTRWTQPELIKAPGDRWSDSHPTPSGPFGITPARGEKAEILFSDGKYYPLDSYEGVDMKNVSGDFRVRGVGKEVVVFLYRQR